MRFLQRLKTDKKFKLRAILIYIVIVLMAGNISEIDKKEAASQSTCDQYNGLLLTTQIGGCTSAGCAVVAPNAWNAFGFTECLDTFLEGAGLFCTNNPSTSRIKTFMAGSLSQASALCGSTRKAIDSGESFCFKTLYNCIDIPTSEQCDSEIQSTLSGLIDSIWEDNNLPCSTKFYIVAFGGGFIALMLLMAVI